MINMEFIARKTGLSRYTVSRALAGNPKVRPETVQRVLDACEQYGYIRNTQAVSLVKGQSSLIGAVVPYITDDFYGEFIAALDATARARGFQLLYRSSYNNGGTEAEIIRNYLEIKVCAMIVVPCVRQSDRNIRALAAKTASNSSFSICTAR